jgi:multidrug resistance efflux pump
MVGIPEELESGLHSLYTEKKSVGSRKADPDQDLWGQFAEATTAKSFCQIWLSLQCRKLKYIRSGMVLLGSPDHGPFTPAAVWPNLNFDVRHLATAAERALKERRGLLIKIDSTSENNMQEGYHLAYPIELSGKIHGVVVLEINQCVRDEVQDLMRDLHWGAAWLEVMLRRADALRSQEATERLQKVLDSVAGVVEHEQFRPAAMGFVTGLATTLQCDRVSIGFRRRKNVRVVALSHSAEFGEHSNLLRAMESVMEEAIDQNAVIIYPLPSEAPLVVTRAHDDLAQQHGAGAVCTVPIGREGDLFGAITFERPTERPFDESVVELIKAVAAIAGPILEVKRKEERWITTKAAESSVKQLKKFVGPGHFGLKMATVIVIGAVIFFAFATGVHYIRAPTVLEGVVERAIGAPFNGYLMEAPARPGDVVHQGDMLCRLDDREMKLERLRWSTQKEQYLKQQREAMAKHDRAQTLINEAKMDQAEAQVALLDEQLSRAKIVAPFDGIVTSGDFTQSLGTPVERGQVLFEVAPLRGYRVIVQVDERDVGWIALGQQGELALPSVPGVVFPLTVTRITPISTAKEGRNYFRVEAELQNTSKRLRPGMEGVGKISAGRAKLIWIWTHEVIEWIRLKLWTYWA